MTMLFRALQRAQRLLDKLYWRGEHRGGHHTATLSFRPGFRFALQSEVELVMGPDPYHELYISLEFGWVWFCFSYICGEELLPFDDVPAGARKVG